MCMYVDACVVPFPGVHLIDESFAHDSFNLVAVVRIACGDRAYSPPANGCNTPISHPVFDPHTLPKRRRRRQAAKLLLISQWSSALRDSASRVLMSTLFLRQLDEVHDFGNNGALREIAESAVGVGVEHH